MAGVEDLAHCEWYQACTQPPSMASTSSLPPGSCLEFWMMTTSSLDDELQTNPNNPFPPQGACGHGIITAIENLTKTSSKEGSVTCSTVACPWG